MVNVNKLKGKIVENGFSVSVLADKIGMDKATLYRKLNDNGDYFTIAEADRIVNALNLNSKEGTAIFFAQFVADMR